MSRVVPDVRDGLSSASRSGLCALWRERARTPQYVKSTRIVDSVAGNSRADGDGAGIYRELVRMARDFELRYPLVDGQGNLGSIDDDPWADMDYTEMRLAPIAGELLRDVAEAVVGAGLRGERAALPARFPNLLVNGSFGAATDAASSIPPHNLREVIDATIAYIDDPSIDIDGLMEHMSGPDLPTGGIIVGRDALRDAYATGRAEVVLRGNAHTERSEDPDYEHAIVITELPFMLTKGGDHGLQADIVHAIKRRRITGISQLEDRSSERNGIRLVVDLEPGVAADAVLEELYKHTRLQTTFKLTIVALVDGVAQTLSLRDAIAHYVDHQSDVVARLTGHRSQDRIREVVKNDLRDLAERYGDPRRTQII